MDDITTELQGFATHCMESGQEQVADLQHRAIQKIEQLQAELKQACCDRDSFARQIAADVRSTIRELQEKDDG